MLPRISGEHQQRARHRHHLLKRVRHFAFTPAGINIASRVNLNVRRAVLSIRIIANGFVAHFDADLFKHIVTFERFSHAARFAFR